MEQRRFHFAVGQLESRAGRYKDILLEKTGVVTGRWEIIQGERQKEHDSDCITVVPVSKQMVAYAPIIVLLCGTPTFW